MMMVLVIVAVDVGMRVIMGVIVIVRMRMAEHMLVAMIVAVVMGPVFMVLEDRLHTRSNRHLGLRLRVELLAEQQHQGRSEERE
jgi:hypothetical protein